VPITAADRVEILELIARYNRAADTGKPEEWAACFLPDGEFEGLVGHVRGHAALEQQARDYATLPEYAEFRRGQHWVNNVVIDELGEDEATVFAHHVLINPSANGGAEITVIGWYDDRVRKVDGSWRFAKRKVNVLQTSVPWPPEPPPTA
jgi:hypothetical protein